MLKPRLSLKRGMGNGQWAMGNGQWAMGNGQWAMGNGESENEGWENGRMGEWENGNGERGTGTL